MTDPISDMLTRIRNALAAKHDDILIPSSKLKFKLASILEKERYVGQRKEVDVAGKKNIKIKLRYENNKPSINSIKRVSKPGLRVYCGKDELPNVLQGYGVSIISTPQGLMTNKDARKNGIGGEVICEIS